MKLFGEKIRQLRTLQHLPLRKVAAYLDIDTSILSKIERGERDANKELVIKIAEFFKQDPTQMLTDYLSDCVAKYIYSEPKTEEILKVAEVKIRYMKQKKSVQSKIPFENE